MNHEDLLTDTLHDRVERTDYPSTPLAAVAGRAGAIRARRRRTTALAAAAAVAVVVVPGAVWLGRSPDASPRPGQTLSSGPTSSPTRSQVAPGDLASLPLGAKPGIDYLADDTYVAMDGRRTTDPALRLANAATPVRGGLLFAVPAKTSPDVARLWLRSQGNDQSLGCGSKHFAMSTDGTQTAYWVMDSCTAGSAGKLYDGLDNTMAEGGAGSVPTPTGEVIDPVGIQSGSVVVNSWRGQHPTPELIDAYTGNATPLSALRLVTGSDENNRVVSGEIAGNPLESAVVDARTGAVLWRTGWQLGQFSDDGKYVIGMQSGDGSPDSYSIFDAVTGERIRDLPHWGLPGWIRQVAWDFDDTVLAVADGSDGEAIIRFDLRGRLSRATPIGPPTESVQIGGYRLATRP
jgi:hypothetical protein